MSNFQNSIKFLSISASIIALSGCASLTHYNKVSTAKIGNGNSQQISFVDAKQRVITSTVKNGEIRTCAEPSPDALSAIAASQGLSLNKGSVDAALSNAFSEGAASIGLRTQSIQLMRDAMYRLCESHASGGIDGLTFETLHRRFQSSMVAILAIEQLTDAVRAPAVNIGGDATAGNAELVAKYTDLSESRKAALKSATDVRDSHKTGAHKTSEDALKTKRAATATKHNVTEDNLTDTQKKEYEEEQKAFDAADSRLKELEKTVVARQADLDSAEAARQAALAGSTATSRTIDIENLSESKMENERVATVAKAVEGIVQNTLTLGFAREFCTTILIDTARLPLKPSNADLQKVRNECTQYMNAGTGLLLAQRRSAEDKSRIVGALVANAPNQKNLLKALEILNKTPPKGGSGDEGDGSPPPPFLPLAGNPLVSGIQLAGGNTPSLLPNGFSRGENGSIIDPEGNRYPLGTYIQDENGSLKLFGTPDRK